MTDPMAAYALRQAYGWSQARAWERIRQLHREYDTLGIPRRSISWGKLSVSERCYLWAGAVPKEDKHEDQT